MRAEHLIRRIHCLSALHHHAANIQTFSILPNFLIFMCIGCLALETARQTGQTRRLSSICIGTYRNFRIFVTSYSFIVRCYILWKCFSQVLTRKCGNFLIAGRYGWHSLSNRLLWKDTHSIPISHIYPSVGYCVVYCYRVIPQPSCRWTEVSSTLLFISNERLFHRIWIYV